MPSELVSRVRPLPSAFITKISVSTPVLGLNDMKKMCRPVVDQDGARLVQSTSASPGVLGVRLTCPLPSAFITNTDGYPSRELMNASCRPLGDQTAIWLSGGAAVRRVISPVA